MSTDTDDFGTRIKSYEAQETERSFIKTMPVYCRIDGRSFGTFTRSLEKPFDERFMNIMVKVAETLVKDTHAILSYVQSDEISLAWHKPDRHSEIFFNGKIFKMTSCIAGLASAKFNQLAMEYWPDLVTNVNPHFDCRVFMVPNMVELMNCFLWREQDAKKNAISQVAQSEFSDAQLYKKNGEQKIAMLKSVGVDYFDAYDERHRRGTYVQRRVYDEPLSEDYRLSIPEHKRPPAGELVRRGIVEPVKMPSFEGMSVEDRIEHMFNKTMRDPCQNSQES